MEKGSVKEKNFLIFYPGMRINHHTITRLQAISRGLKAFKLGS